MFWLPAQRIVLENIIFDPSILKYLYIRPENDVHYLDFIYLLPQLEPAVRFSALTQLDDEELQKLIVLVQLFDSEQTVQRPVGQFGDDYAAWRNHRAGIPSIHRKQRRIPV